MQLRDRVELALSFQTTTPRNRLGSTKPDGAPSLRCPGVCEAEGGLRPCVAVGFGTRPLLSGSLT